MRKRSAATVALTSLLLASCASVSAPAPNGEAILKEEKLRATPVVERIEKPASPTDFTEDGTKSCAGTVCVEKAESHSGSGSLLSQLSCSSMGEMSYVADVPPEIRDGSVSAEVLPKCDRLTLTTVDQKTKNAKVTERNGKWFRYEEVSKIP